MRALKTEDTNKLPKDRSLKIHPYFKSKRWSNMPTTIPFILLSGRWLDKLGFSPYQRVKVTTRNKLLVIQLEEQEEEKI